MHKELTIPVPWGHIAAKAWGSEEGRPVLGIHGFLDNANTFDRLVHYLPNDFYFVSIDLPGHGRSSHRPQGVLQYHTDYVLDIKRVADGLKWKKFSIIGHSLGAGIAFLFAAAFPESVDKIVLIDNITPVPRPPDYFGKNLRTSLLKHIQKEKFNKDEAKLYNEEELLKRFLDGHQWCTEESAKILAKRGVQAVETPEGRKFAFTRDPRLKVTFTFGTFKFKVSSKQKKDSMLAYARTFCDTHCWTPDPVRFTVEELDSCLKLVNCEVLFVRAKQGLESQNPLITTLFNSNLDKMRLHCKKLEIVEVDGNHHAHLNNPENVAPSILKFLQPSFTSKL